MCHHHLVLESKVHQSQMIKEHEPINDFIIFYYLYSNVIIMKLLFISLRSHCILWCYYHLVRKNTHFILLFGLLLP